MPDDRPDDDHLEGLKKGDLVEIESGSGYGAGAKGWFHGITLDGRYDIELGFNLDWPHRHVYLDKTQIRRLSESEKSGSKNVR